MSKDKIIKTKKMDKEYIKLTKDELEFILAQGMGYVWNEANIYKNTLSYPMEAYDNTEKKRIDLVNQYFNILSKNGGNL